MSVAPKTRPHHEHPHLPSGQFHHRENGPHKHFPVESTGVRKFSLPEQDLHFLKKSLSDLFPPAFFSYPYLPFYPRKKTFFIHHTGHLHIILNLYICLYICERPDTTSLANNYIFTNISKRIYLCSLADLDAIFNKRTCRVNYGYTFIHKITHNFIASYLVDRCQLPLGIYPYHFSG